MAIANGGDLPSDSTVILLVTGSKRIPRVGPCERIDSDALRCDDDGISVTWVEFFPGAPDRQLAMACHAMKGDLVIRASAVIACASVEQIISVMDQAGRRVRVIRDEQPSNSAHCLIQGINADEAGLLLALADAFSLFVPATEIAGLVG